MSTDVRLLWATPLLRSETGTEALAGELRDLILSCETEAFRKPNSPQRRHDGVFESTFDFLSWKDESVQNFREVFFGYLGSFVKLVNNLSDDELNKLKFDNHCWFHITRDGGYFQPHNHPNASWSAIYCVDPGDDAPESESNAGHLTLTDPRGTNCYLDAANRGMRRDVSFDALRFRPKLGELILFPSYLYHFVEPYQGERPRITIAANFWFRTES